MKYGVRKPNIKKSIKARTTGKMKRQVKKAVNPLYGKKGMGVINNPKKAAYNAVYNRTTVGVSDISKSVSPSNTSRPVRNPPAVRHEYSDRTYNICGILAMISGIILALIGLLLMVAVPIGGIIAIAAGVFFFIIGRKYRNIAKTNRNSNIA